MSEYLQPNDELSIENQRSIFSIRNRMVDIPSNFSSKEENESKCLCGEMEDMKHIYYCKYLNSEDPEESYEKLFGENIQIQAKVFKRFENNLIRREKLLKNPNENECDPL